MALEWCQLEKQPKIVFCAIWSLFLYPTTYSLGIANIFLTVVQLLSPYHCLQGTPGYEARMTVAIC